MLPVPATAGAVLLQREPIWIVSLVLFGVIVALFTVGARQRDEYAVSLLGHMVPLRLLIVKKLVARAHGEDRTHDLTLTKGVLYH
jgi:hypothetical protein